MLSFLVFLQGALATIIVLTKSRHQTPDGVCTSEHGLIPLFYNN